MSSAPEPAHHHPLFGHVALVTGGGRGIGRAVSLALARAGALVAPVARTRDELALVIKEIASHGGRVPAEPLVADVRRPDELSHVLSRVEAAGGPPDILVTAAGVARYTEVARLDPADWDEHLAVNLSGVFHAVRLVLPSMLERGEGDIVTIGSVASIKAFPSSSAYSASKFGVLGFTRVLREEVRSKGVRVTCVLPGATDTPLWGTPLPVPAERMMPAESVASAVLHALTADPRAVVEEILLRPVLGDI